MIVAILLVGTAYDLLLVRDCDLSAPRKEKEGSANSKIQKLIDDESLPLLSKSPQVEVKPPYQPGKLRLAPKIEHTVK